MYAVSGRRQAGPATSRSGFRDYAAEQTHTPHAIMEAALAHAVKDKAEATYARATTCLRNGAP